MARLNYSSVVYAENDILDVELENQSSGLVSDIGIIPEGKQRIKVTGKEMGTLINLVRSEEDQETLDFYAKQYEKKKEEFLKNNIGSDIDPVVAETLLMHWTEDNKLHPYAKFFEDNKRDIKPLTSLKIVKNLGPKADDAVTLQNDRTKIVDQLNSIVAKNDEKSDAMIEAMMELIKEIKKPKKGE